MSHEFEIREEVSVEASPDEVWKAIASGPGIDSWFLGRNTFEPHPGGAFSRTHFGRTTEGTVTAWEPKKRFGYQTNKNADGSFQAFEFLIEARSGGSTVLRLVHSGIIGEDWEAEYDALTNGDRVYLRKLITYLRYFSVQASTYNIFLAGPHVADASQVWRVFLETLGMTEPVTHGAPARVAIEGLTPIEGTVEFVVHSRFLAIVLRTSRGLYTFSYGYKDLVFVQYHNFSDDVDKEATERAWRTWLNTTFSQSLS